MSVNLTAGQVIETVLVCHVQDNVTGSVGDGIIFLRYQSNV